MLTQRSVNELQRDAERYEFVTVSADQMKEFIECWRKANPVPDEPKLKKNGKVRYGDLSEPS